MIKMSMKEKLFSRCETEADSDSPTIPIYFINLVLNHGEELFYKTKRDHIIENCKAQFKTLSTYWWRMKRRVGDKLSREYNREIFWAGLYDKLSDKNRFLISLLSASRGSNTKITYEQAEDLEDSYGSPQLKTFLKQRSEEAENNVLEMKQKMGQLSSDLRRISDSCQQIKDTVDILKRFNYFVYLLDDEVNHDNIKRFEETRIRARMGVSRVAG